MLKCRISSGRRGAVAAGGGVVAAPILTFVPSAECPQGPVASGLHLCSSSTPGTGADGPSLLTPPTPAHCLGLIREKVSSECYHQVTNPLQPNLIWTETFSCIFCMIYFICCFEKGCCFDQNWIWLHNNSYLFTIFLVLFQLHGFLCVCV